MNYLRAVGILIFPVFCLLATLFALIADPYFTYAILDSIGKNESIQPTKQLFSAAAGFSKIPQQFIGNELSHLEDVIFLIRLGFLIFIFTFFIFAYLIKKNNFIKKGFYFYLILLIIMIIMPFQKIFTLFHLVLFPQGNWTFPAESIIIQTYPFEFFYYYAIFLAIYSIFLAIMLYCSNYIFNHAKA